MPIYDFAMANVVLANNMGTDECHPCCGKSSCGGCIITSATYGKAGKCPFCNNEGKNNTHEEQFEEMMKRVEANDAGAMCALGCYYSQGLNGLQQDPARAMELFAKAAELGSSHAHYQVGVLFDQGGNLKKAKFHWDHELFVSWFEIRSCK